MADPIPTDCPPGITGLQQCPPQLAGLENVIGSLLGIIARLVGIAVFVMLVVGGFNLLTASGDPKKAEAAQKTITGAVVGIVIIIAGWFLLNILKAVTNVNLTSFSICITTPC